MCLRAAVTLAATPGPLALTGHCCILHCPPAHCPALGAARSLLLSLRAAGSTMTAAWELEVAFPHHSCVSSSSEEVFHRCLFLHLPHQAAGREEEEE